MAIIFAEFTTWAKHSGFAVPGSPRRAEQPL
jgi:hypothetical protein